MTKKRDFFISYNKDNKDWAKWIGGTLEENGYSVYLQAWDIAPGQDFIERMNDFLNYSKHYIAVYSRSFEKSEYCMKEFQTAFNSHLTRAIDMFLPVRVEEAPLGPLYQTTVYIDLFKLPEDKAAKALLNGIGHTPNPRKKGAYPGIAATQAQKSRFPGCTKNEDMRYRNILILGKNKPERDDQVNRLICDVFHTLGFDESSVQKDRRNMNTVLKHRTENRIAFIKCKAQKAPVSGAELNQFVGALDVERGKYESEGIRTIGYFVSKSGFTRAALEQEQARHAHTRDEDKSLILLGTDEIIRELVCGNVICSLERAIDAVKKPANLHLCQDVDLIASSFGWVWVLYYSHSPQQPASHFAFVHADGNPLLNQLASELLQTPEISSQFSSLTYVEASTHRGLNQKAARTAYFQYLEKELGEIQFEGMPTDKEAGAVKVQLENIFVPLSFYNDHTTDKILIHGVLASHRAAILAKPGGGKSTLIRRIALAYAYPDRRKKVDDGLPDYEWFPIYIRCRDLGEEANNGILEIISSIVRRAEIRQHKEAFDSLVEDALQNGTVLLLIDGLDEIANETYRIRFVNQLRTFIATYPAARLLITSREAGFRAVADTLTGYCDQYSIASLGDKEIRALSLKWHQAILGDGKQAIVESEKVCDTILNDTRILSLAENPLLLTTLLFVKRWVGYLPTKKCHLYEEMIKLLLVTWNAVAHEKLDMDETEPQLAYIAYTMTLQGKQKITKDELASRIREARKELPELLSYTTLSAEKFITQVEERSSLLIQLGLEENDAGMLVPSYEFSHLSFQEYLTSKAIAKGWIPDADSVTPLEVLQTHLEEEHWKEVVPMVAVLSGRRQAKEIMEYLLQECQHLEQMVEAGQLDKQEIDKNKASFHLANCVASEVPISAELLEEAIHCIIKGKRRIDMVARKSPGLSPRNSIVSIILKSKYGDMYQTIAEASLRNMPKDLYVYEYCDAWIRGHVDDAQPLWMIVRYFAAEDPVEHIKGALSMMRWAFRQPRPNRKEQERTPEQEADLLTVFRGIIKLLEREDTLSQFAATWCIAWAGYNEHDLIPESLYVTLSERLFPLWVKPSKYSELNRICSWAVKSIIRPELRITKEDQILADCIEERYHQWKNEFDAEAALGVALLSKHWSTAELSEKVKELEKKSERRFVDSLYLKRMHAYIKAISANEKSNEEPVAPGAKTS
ncbi:MAG: TIR domain-containing protein [Clostridia bacterium]|nr:TIR domain-containing protein [Clostridia bacterium]